jgi:hypothetical protein
MEPRCQICGSHKTADAKNPALCQYFCYWLLEGWLGWNARLQTHAVCDQRAQGFVGAPLSLTYPKLIALARMLGWHGRENVVGTF